MSEQAPQWQNPMNDAIEAGRVQAFNNEHLEAQAMNKQIDQGAVQAEKMDAIQDRYNSPNVSAMNEAADIAIFGSRGRTEGYVDAAGNPLTSPIEGKVDQIRDKAGIADMRKNPRYGTIKSDREAKADAQGVENNRKAEGYVRSVEALRAEGFELTQAKLILDLREEQNAKNRSLYNKLLPQYAGTMSPAEARDAARHRVINLSLKQGNDEALTKRLIREEGLFDRSEYDKFRFKRGNPKNGERKEFTAYRQRSIAEDQARTDADERSNIEAALDAKALAREQVRNAERDGRGEDPTLPHPIPVVNASPKGLRARARDLMAKSGAYLGVKLLNAREYFTDDEKGTRRKVTAGVIGAIATAGLVYLDVKSGGGSHHVAEQHGPKGQGQIEPHLKAGQFTGGTPPVGHESHVVHQMAHEAKPHQVVMQLYHRNPAIEDSVAKYLHTSLKDPSVTKVTGAILHNQGLSWDDARHLPAGYSFNMPPQHVIEEIVKNSKAS